MSLGIKYHLLSSPKLFVLRLYIFDGYPIGLNQTQQLSLQKLSSSLHSSVCCHFADSSWSTSGFFGSSSYSEPEGLICPGMQRVYPAGWNSDVHEENWIPRPKLLGLEVIAASLEVVNKWPWDLICRASSCLCPSPSRSSLEGLPTSRFAFSSTCPPLWTDRESGFGLITYT